MKIGFLLSSFLPHSIGGTEIYVYRLIKILQQSNISCFVLTSSNIPSENEYEYQGIRVINIYPVANAQNARHDLLKQIMVKDQPDLFHVHELVSPDGFTVSDLEVFYNNHVPIVTTLHVLRYSCFMQDLKYKGVSDCDGICESLKCTTCFLARKKTGVLNRFIAVFSRYLYFNNQIINTGSSKLNTMANIYSILSRHIDNLDAIFSFSSSVVSVAQWYYDILLGIKGASKLELIQTGLFEKMEEKNKNSTGKIVFAYCGRLTPDKGIDILIDAFISMASNHHVLKIYSDTENETNPFVASCIDKTKSFANVLWCKPFPPEDSKKVLDAIEVLVVPTRITEMSPLVIHEAKSTGIFVVASSNKGNVETLRNYTRSILYPENKFESLAQAMLQVSAGLLFSPLGFGNDKSFQFEHTASQYLDLYNSVLSKSMKITDFPKSLFV